MNTEELENYLQRFNGHRLGGPGTPAIDNPDANPACPFCGGLGYTRSNIADIHADGFGQLVPCECTRCASTARKNERLATISGLLPAEREITMNDFIFRCSDTPKMVEVVERFISKPSGFLTLWGGVGNGKTLALMAISNAYRSQLKVAVYVTFTELLDYIRCGFDENATETASARIDAITNAYVLCIDEMDKTKITDYADEFRFRLLDRRYRMATDGCAHTVFAMNENPRTFPAHINDRLYDGRFVVFHNADPSIRPAMR